MVFWAENINKSYLNKRPTSPAENIQSPNLKSHIKWLCGKVLLASTLLLAILYAFGHAENPKLWFKNCHGVLKQGSIESRVHRILSEVPLIDGHNDLPIFVRMMYGNKIHTKNFTFGTEKGLEGHVDLRRLRKGQVGGTFWSVFVECPSSDVDDHGVEFGSQLYARPVHETLQQIDLVHRLISEYHEDLALATSSRGVMSIFRAGKVASMIGAEGLHQIDSIATLRMYYRLGVRYITLTHFCNNKYADGAGVPKARWNGLSPDGYKLIREMNRLGMLVDLSHVTPEVMKDVLSANGSIAPVIFSHSSAFAICPHVRNVPDDILWDVKANGGVVMVNIYPSFVSCGPGKEADDADLSLVVDHIEHIGKLIGWEHVGIGSDFDGIETVPKGLEDVSKFPDLFAELLRRGVSDVEAKGVAGMNLLRVWARAEEVSKRLRTGGQLELEDDL